MSAAGRLCAAGVIAAIAAGAVAGCGESSARAAGTPAAAPTAQQSSKPPASALSTAPVAAARAASAHANDRARSARPPAARSVALADVMARGLARIASDMRAATDAARLGAAVARGRAEIRTLLTAARGGARSSSVTVLELRRLSGVLALAPANGRLGDDAAALIGGEAERLATDLGTRLQRREPGLTAAGPALPAPRAPATFRNASAISASLFRARWELARADPARAAAAVAAGRRAAAALTPPVAGLRAGISRAERAARAGDAVALAAARGRVEGLIATTAYERALRAASTGRGAVAARWVALRDFGPTKAAPAVRADAARAVSALRSGVLSPRASALAIRRDELDVFQRRAVALVQEAGVAGYQHRDADRAEAAATAAAYWRVLAPDYSRLVSRSAQPAVSRAFAALATLPAHATNWRLDAELETAMTALGQFTAAPPTASESSERAQRLVSLTSLTTSQLCDRNAPGRTRAGDLGEGAVGPAAMIRLIRDVRPTISAASAARLNGIVGDLQRLPRTAGILGEEGAPPPKEVPPAALRLCDRIRSAVASVFPDRWRRVGGDRDIDRVEAQLARMQSAADAGDWEGADRARRDAYAIFELGPEARLWAFAPELAYRIEGLFWASAPDGPNLVDVISGHSSSALVHARRSATVAALEQARAALNRSHSAAAVRVDSAIVVFREGLEAALILAALAASFAVGGGAWRRPLIGGMLLALPATIVTWFATGAAVRSLSSYTLVVEAVLDALALAVLFVIMAWFFQRFCWTRFVAKQHARHRRLARTAAPTLGLGLLGFTILYREGVETVIFLRALQLDAGTATVLQGVLLGAAFTTALALLMLRLRRKLPYRAIVVATAVVIGLLTVVMAGQAARAAQAAGWLAVDPVGANLPAWAGQWLGLYPATETLVAQALAAIGVAALGVAIRTRRERRAARQIELARRLARERKHASKVGAPG